MTDPINTTLEQSVNSLTTYLQKLPQDRQTLLEMAKKAGPPIVQKVMLPNGTIKEVKCYSLKPLLKEQLAGA